MKLSYAKGFKRLVFLKSVLLAVIFVTAIIPFSALANFTYWTGNNSTNWNDPGNWSNGAPGAADTTVVVFGSPNQSPIINSTISGYLLRIGGMINTTPPTFQSGELIINGNGALTMTRYVALGYDEGTSGTLTVTGPNASLTITGTSGDGFFAVADNDNTTGTVTVSDGALIDTFGSFYVTFGTNSTGTVTVDNATLKIGDNSYIGIDDQATLTVQNGGTFISGYNQTTTTPDYIGINSSANGTVIVSGSGSTFTDYNPLVIGYSGNGTLTIADNSTTSLLQGVTVAQNAGSIGTINIGAAANEAAVAPGALITSTINFGNGIGNIVFNHTSDNYIFAPVITGGSATTSSVDVYSGTTFMTGQSTYFGPTTIHGGTLAAGATNVFSANSNYNIQSGGTLDLLHFNQTVANVTNAGTVRIQGDPGITLTTNNYIGNNGNLFLDTFLDNDNSPSDKLVINGGSATGSTKVFINNVGGNGAITTNNGILVIDAINNGTTAPGAFVQGGDIVAGPFIYNLYKGGIDGSNPENWYLRSIMPISPIVPPIPPMPFIPNIPIIPPGFIPNFRPIVSLFTAIPSVSMLYNQLIFDTLHQRVGEEEQLLCDPTLASRSWANGGWVRGINKNGQRTNGGIFRDGPDFDYNFDAIEGGIDLYHQRHNNNHSDFVGVFGVIGGSKGGVKNIFNRTAGTNRFNANTGGLYWTHFGPNGWYLDAIAQGTSQQITSYNNSDYVELSTRGKDWGVSLEGGYPFMLGYDFVIEPQTQISFQKLTINDAQAKNVTVHFDNTQSTIGRVGAMFSKSWDISNSRYCTQSITGWFSANLWHEFDGNSTTSFSSDRGYVPFHSTIHGTKVDLGAGISMRLLKNGTVYATYNREELLGQGKGHSNEGNIGIRINI